MCLPSRRSPIRMTEYSNGPRSTCAGASRKSDKFTFGRAWTIPAPALPRYVSALTSAEAPGCALIAATT